MDEKTKALVEAAEQRANDSTPGPWSLVGPGCPNNHRITSSAWSVAYILEGPLRPSHGEGNYQGHSREDALFIAHARQDIPALCAVVREQNAEIERLRKDDADTQVRRALCTLLDRLGGDGVVAFLNKMTPTELEDEIYQHVRFLEERDAEQARAQVKPPPPPTQP